MGLALGAACDRQRSKARLRGRPRAVEDQSSRRECAEARPGSATGGVGRARQTSRGGGVQGWSESEERDWTQVLLERQCKERGRKEKGEGERAIGKGSRELNAPKTKRSYSALLPER